MTTKTKIKIGGVSYNLEDLPLSFQEAFKKSIDKERIKDGGIVQTLSNRKERIGSKIGILRKMFGYKGGLK